MILSKNEIKTIIPHREPLLLVDSVIELEPGKTITTSLFVDPTWSIFQGHFPGDPVLPGIYLIEAMAQTADLMLLTLDDQKGKVPLLFQVGQMRFQRKVVPGETLTMSASVMLDAGSGMYECRVSASGSDGVAARGTLTLALK